MSFCISRNSTPYFSAQAERSNVIDVYIRYLRKKIDEGQEKKLIHTVRGAGYVLKEQE